MRILKHISILVALFCCLAAQAQNPTWEEAYNAYIEANNSSDAADLQKAKELIDVVAAREADADNPKVWLIKGWVYKDLFKTVDNGEPTSKYRPIAMESLFRAWKMNADISPNAKAAYEFLSSTLFNDAARSLNNMNSDLAKALFEDYRQAELKLDPDKNLQPKEIEFKNALGTLYTKKMRMEKDLKWYEEAVKTYEGVLLMDPGNYGANYNLAILHYNRGVHNIFTISPENDIISVKEIQFVSKEYFIQSLPYMLKAHELKPKRKETLIGLEGIYYSLQDYEKSEYYGGLLQDLLQEENK